MEYVIIKSDELYHHGIKGQKWGVRRFQNEDGTLTPAGRNRYYDSQGNLTKAGAKHGSKLTVSLNKLSKRQAKAEADEIKYTYKAQKAKNANKAYKNAEKARQSKEEAEKAKQETERLIAEAENAGYTLNSSKVSSYHNLGPQVAASLLLPVAGIAIAGAVTANKYNDQRVNNGGNTQYRNKRTKYSVDIYGSKAR